MDPATGTPIKDLMVSAAAAGDLFVPGSEDPSQPDEVADADPEQRPDPVMMGFHQVNFNSDKEVQELSAGIGAAVVGMMERQGVKPGTRTEGQVTTITHIGGVAIPREHGTSREAADRWLQKQART